MQKELVSLSPKWIGPGQIELGTNRPADQVMRWVVGGLALGAAIAAFGASWPWAAGLAAVAVLLEANRRWAGRCHLSVQGRRVVFTPLRGRKKVRCEASDASVDVYSFPSEGAGMHHSARIRFLSASIPDILIQDSVPLAFDEQAELRVATDFAESLRAALGAAPTLVPNAALPRPL